MSELKTDPWKLMAMIVEAANETGVEVERAMRFMAAFSLRMTAAQQAEPPGPKGLQ